MEINELGRWEPLWNTVDKYRVVREDGTDIGGEVE